MGTIIAVRNPCVDSGMSCRTHCSIILGIGRKWAVTSSPYRHIKKNAKNHPFMRTNERTTFNMSRLSMSYSVQSEIKSHDKMVKIDIRNLPLESVAKTGKDTRLSRRKSLRWISCRVLQTASQVCQEIWNESKSWKSRSLKISLIFCKLNCTAFIWKSMISVSCWFRTVRFLDVKFPLHSPIFLLISAKWATKSSANAIENLQTPK